MPSHHSIPPRAEESKLTADVTELPAATPPSALVDVDFLRRDVDAHLKDIAAEIRSEAYRAGSGSASLVDRIDSLLTGGKRLRAAFAYWSWRAHGGADEDRPLAIALGAGFELFQAAALLHDDVIDRSDTRRGLPSAHRSLTDLHLSQQWSGEAAHFGISGAILAGDLVLVASGQVIGEVLIGRAATHQVGAANIHRLWGEMSSQVTTGQYLDILAECVPWGADPQADERLAREVIVAKTVLYSVQSPLKIGASLANATAEQVRKISDVGLPLGEAFQLRDDVLGIFGDPATTGKPAGDDIVVGKRTVIMAKTASRSSPREREFLRSVLSSPTTSQSDVDAVRKIVVDSGALHEVESLIKQLHTTALEALESLDLEQRGKQMLKDLADAAVRRTS